MFAVFFSDDENMWNILIFIVENLNFQDLTRSCTCTFLVKSGPWWTEWQKAHIFIYSREHHLDQAIIWGELSVSVWFAAILKHKICSFGTTNMWFAENTVCCTEALIQKQLWQSQKHPDNTILAASSHGIVVCSRFTLSTGCWLEGMEATSKSCTVLLYFPNYLNSGDTVKRRNNPSYPWSPISNIPVVLLRVYDDSGYTYIVSGTVCSGLTKSF